MKEYQYLKVGWIYPLLLFISFFTYPSCERSDNPLPPMTREGRNTMGYVFSPHYSVFCLTEVHDFLDFNSDTLMIHDSTFVSMKYDDAGLVLDIVLCKDQGSNDFNLNSVRFKYNDEKMVLDSTQNSYFEISYHNPGRRILSGIFDFFLGSKDTIWTSDTTFNLHWETREHIQDGRFDLKY